jgi:CRISPR-associated endonuclease/helicase Cas3
MGGYDTFGWAPDCFAPVQDIADACAVDEDDGSRPLTLRLHPAVDQWIPEAPRRTVHEAAGELYQAEHQFDEEEGPDEERIAAAWQTLRDAFTAIEDPWVRRLGLSIGYRWLPDGWLVLRREGVEGSEERGIDAGRPVELDEHSTGVAALVDSLAHDHPQRERLVCGAQGHDQGKRVHAFQVVLYGDPVLAAAGPALAKSGLRSRRARQAAWARSGLPRGFRHELCSLDYLDDDDPLLHHVVATHHGYGRPWFPPPQGEAPAADRVHLTGGSAARFSKLLHLLGPWRLAEMEMLLRAADIRRSIEEARP